MSTSADCPNCGHPRAWHLVDGTAHRIDCAGKDCLCRSLNALIAEDRRSDAREAMADVVEQAAAMDGEDAL